MTPKEKAEKLYLYHENLLSPCFKIIDEFAKSRIIKCAILTVDEIILELSHNVKYDWLKFREEKNDYIIYWIEVKQELENMIG